MAIKIEEFVAYLGWDVDDKSLKEFDASVKEVGKTVAGLAAAVAAAAAATLAAITVTNKHTSELKNLAGSVGLTVETLQGLSGVVAGIGLETTHVIDLAKELNKKLGEKKSLGQMAAVDDALKALAVDFKDLEKLDPEGQLVALLDAARGLDDAQTAGSALDKLLGGEAVKVAGYLRTLNLSMGELLDEQKALNFLTSEGADAASMYTLALGDVTRAAGSMLAEFSALVGAALTPALVSVRAWVVENRELIKAKIDEWARRVGDALIWLWDKVDRIRRGFGEFIDRLGGAENALKIFVAVLGAVTFYKLIKEISTVGALLGPLILKFGNLNKAMAFSKLAGAIGLMALAGLAINSLFRSFEGKDSLVADIGAKIGESLHKLSGDIARLFGSSQEEFDRGFLKFLDNFNDWDEVLRLVEGDIGRIVWLLKTLNSLLEKISNFGKGALTISPAIKGAFEIVSGQAPGYSVPVGQAPGGPAAQESSSLGLTGTMLQLLGISRGKAPLAGPSDLSHPGTSGPPLAPLFQTPPPSAAPAAGGKSINNFFNLDVNMTPAQGVTGADAGREIVGALRREVSNAASSSRSGVEY